MISENGIPTPLLHQYATGDEVKRKEALTVVLRGAYPYLFESQEFSIQSGTASQLREVLRLIPRASGETLGRCISFVKDAALDAGFAVSPFILQKKGRFAGLRKKNGVATRKAEKVAGNAPIPPSPGPPQQSTMPAQTSLLLSGLFQRLPKPGTKWGKEDRERWVQTLQNVLLLEYPEL